jgi:3-oxoacyl-[acyl-carrier protein] reductase
MTTSRKVALVTGAATGIGRAVAIRFATQGLAVAVNYSRSEAEAKETLDAIRKHDVPAILCQANVADDAAVRAMLARVHKELGGLDVLVNNAATTHFIDHTDLEAVTEQVWDQN